MSAELLRQLPSVDRAQREVLADLQDQLPRVLVTSIVRKEVESLRTQVLSGEIQSLPEQFIEGLKQKLHHLARARIQPVLNATGVMIHTNLGRSPLSPQVMADLSAVASGYANVELDLTTGERGTRALLVEEALACLCGAEAATVVNNCAAGLIVTLRALMTDAHREVIVSRGELVEIGGGFRIPEVMQTSGAQLREVGTTNRTRVSDYAKAISLQTAMLLQIHRSNFRMSGFVETPALADLVELGHQHSIPVVSDLGSGSMLDTQSFGMSEHEVTPREIIAAGADLVIFSGDKLLGGPQAGIIAGKHRLIDKIKHEPFFRAVRCDKLMLTALQSTALAYLEAHSQEKPTVPTVRLMQMAALSQDELRHRGQALLDQLQHPRVELAESRTRFGGGTMPEIEAQSIALKIRCSPQQVDSLLAVLRQQTPPVIGYAREGAVWLDLRTIMPEQDRTLWQAVQKAL